MQAARFVRFKRAPHTTIFRFVLIVRLLREATRDVSGLAFASNQRQHGAANKTDTDRLAAVELCRIRQTGRLVKVGRE